MTDELNRLKELTRNILKQETQLDEISKQKDMLLDLLNTLNFVDSDIDGVVAILKIVKDFTGVEAAAIRIEDGKDYPYYVVRGFPEEFVKIENSLCSKDGTPDDENFECFCGCVIRECAGHEYEYFTHGGSFFTADASALIQEHKPIPEGIKVRATCLKFGYETIALIPLRSREKIIGLLQLNDKRKSAISKDTVTFFEKAGLSIGVALERIRLLNKLKAECLGEGNDRPNKDNKLQADNPTA
jgi:GAF domain-containing protein